MTASAPAGNSSAAAATPLAAAAVAAAAAAAGAAQAYLVDQGISLSHEDVALLVFDDATQQLLAVKGGHVFAHDAAAAAPHNLRWMYPLQDGPPVRALRPSLDNALLAVQRSRALLELVDLTSGNCSVYSIHKGQGDILTFFFTDAPDTDFVVVTTRAIELCQFAARRQGLRLRERVRQRSAWALYTHETRMFVAAAAPPASNQLLAWQLTASGIVKLPPFELRGVLPSAAAAREFFPPVEPPPAPAAAAAADAAATPLPVLPLPVLPLPVLPPPPASPLAAANASPAAAAGAGASGAVAASSVFLLKLYGRVYLAHVDGEARRLELYRCYTDTILLQHVYPLYEREVSLSSVDNVLIAHHPRVGVALLFDVALPGQAPVASPLPLKRLDLLPPGTPEDAGDVDASRLGPYVVREAPYSPAWRYSLPGIVVDGATRTLYRLALDLRAVADSCGDAPRLAAFLQRRRPPGAGPLAAEPRALLLALTRSALQERLPVSGLEGVLEQLVGGYAGAMARAGGGGGGLGGASPPPPAPPSAAAAAARSPLAPPPATVVLTPNELASEVFGWAAGEEVVDAGYLQAALAAYVAASQRAGVGVPPALQRLQAETLLQQGLVAQLARLAAAQPGAAGGGPHGFVTAALVAAGGGGGPHAPAARLLALDSAAREAAMEVRVSRSGPALEAYVRALLASGRVVRAARVAREHGAPGVPAARFLEAAAASRDAGAFAAVYRLFPEARRAFPSLRAAQAQYALTAGG